MKASFHDYLDIGIVHFMAYPRLNSHAEYLQSLASIAQDEFFELIEIKYPPAVDVWEQARALLESSGVQVGYSAHPHLLDHDADLNAEDERERIRAVNIVKTAVDQAYFFGAKTLSLLSGKNPEASVRSSGRDQAIGYLIESLKEICSYARSKGDLEILLEPFDDQTDFCRLIGSTSDAVEVAQEVRKWDSSFGLLIDLSHLPMLRESSAHALKTTKDYVRHVHIGNCLIRDVHHPLYGDQHPRFGFPGSEMDVPEIAVFLRGLFEIGYLQEGTRRTLSFEIKPLTGESS
ncbi:MAG: sugar phosphate isomerase/epimerase, partial [Alicyclobacillus sp.]|nr:sugar phosphate isomerase/epimerase [Alicyclobacillus sp.]